MCLACCDSFDVQRKIVPYGHFHCALLAQLVSLLSANSLVHSMPEMFDRTDISGL